MKTKKLDVLLIAPPFSYGRLKENRHVFPPLGLASIAAVLEQEKYLVKILDPLALKLNDYHRHAGGRQFDNL